MPLHCLLFQRFQSIHDLQKRPIELGERSGSRRNLCRAIINDRYSIPASSVLPAQDRLFCPKIVHFAPKIVRFANSRALYSLLNIVRFAPKIVRFAQRQL